jgi:periplasmic copper chaperone A
METHRYRKGHRPIIAAVATLLLASAWPSAAAAQTPSPAAPDALPSPATGALSVEGAWARPSPMVDRAGAAYMVIHNAAVTDDALVAASTPAAAFVEIHQTSEQADGTMAMTPVASIPVPAGGSAVLEPGGYHLMLIDLVAPLEPGAVLEVSLAFESGAELVVPVEVGMPVGIPTGCPMQSMEPGGSPPSGCPMPMPTMGAGSGMGAPMPDASPMPSPAG